AAALATLLSVIPIAAAPGPGDAWKDWTHVTLIWDPSPTPGVEYILIQEQAGQIVRTPLGQSLQVSLNGLRYGRTWRFRVIAVDPLTRAESLPSNPVDYTARAPLQS